MHAHQLRLAKMAVTTRSVRRLHRSSCHDVSRAMFFRHLHKLLELQRTFLKKWMDTIPTKAQLIRQYAVFERKIRESSSHKGFEELFTLARNLSEPVLTLRAELRRDFRNQRCQRYRSIISHAAKVLTGKHLPMELEEMIAIHLQ